MLWAIVKAVSLTYLLGGLGLSLVSLAWYVLRRRLAPAQRAGAGFAAAVLTCAAGLGFGTAIAAGVINHSIRMTTPYFMGLMAGHGALAITLAGCVVLLLSLALFFRSLRHARLPSQRGEVLRAGGIKLRTSDSVQTASLVGAIRPELWVNPAYWSALSDAERQLVLFHESQHLGRRDNLRKLVLYYIAGLYYALPWIRTWPEQYELDSELAVDDICRSRVPESSYRALVGRAVEHAVFGRPAAVQSMLSHADLGERMAVLLKPRRRGNPAVMLAACVGMIATGSAPAVLLLLSPLSRCFLACYLGY